MRKILAICSVAGLLLAINGVAGAQTTMDYDDVGLSGGFQAGHFGDVWDLTQCDLTISFTYDATGLVDDFGGDAHAWAELGIRQIGYGDFNPTWMAEGAGVWLATDYDWNVDTFDPDPEGSPSLDLDDKLILQKGGGQGEGNYNLPSVPPNPWANHAVWFDRDGVDQWQAEMWGAIDGVTYNTGGTYAVVITLHADHATTGTAYMTVNGEPQGFYDPGWHPGPADLMPAGMTFTGDMKMMQVFYGIYGYGPTHSVGFDDITVTGCLTCLDAAIDIDPDTLNLNSQGKWITAYIEPPEGYEVDDIDLENVTLKKDEFEVGGEYGEFQTNCAMVKFPRSAVQDILEPGDVELTITGNLIDGPLFEGTDIIRVIDKGGKGQ
jgi:hypothetical protein